MAYQARCHHCHVHFLWSPAFPLKGAHCPFCRSPLSRTTHTCKDDIDRSTPLYPPPTQLISEVA